LRAALGGSEAEWVLHAGLQDVDLLLPALGMRQPPKIFDTQVAWGLLGPEASVGLSYLTYRVLNIKTSKPHQADDWVRRPLPESQLRYAAGDIKHLPEIHTELKQRADALQRYQTILQASYDSVRPPPEPPDPLSLAGFRNAWQLDEASQAGLLRLIHWYNGLAPHDKRRAPDSKTLLAIASRLPRSASDLGRIKGVPRGMSAAERERLVKVLSTPAPDEGFRSIQAPSYATFEEVAFEGWLGWARASVSVTLEVSPDVVLPRRVIKRMQRAHADHGLEAAFECLTGWRKDLLLAPLRKFAEAHPLVGGA
jgi:ribonuclease D